MLHIILIRSFYMNNRNKTQLTLINHMYNQHINVYISVCTMGTRGKKKLYKNHKSNVEKHVTVCTHVKHGHWKHVSINSHLCIW